MQIPILHLRFHSGAAAFNRIPFVNSTHSSRKEERARRCFTFKKKREQMKVKLAGSLLWRFHFPFSQASCFICVRSERCTASSAGVIETESDFVLTLPRAHYAVSVMPLTNTSFLQKRRAVYGERDSLESLSHSASAPFRLWCETRAGGERPSFRPKKFNESATVWDSEHFALARHIWHTFLAIFHFTKDV